MKDDAEPVERRRRGRQMPDMSTVANSWRRAHGVVPVVPAPFPVVAMAMPFCPTCPMMIAACVVTVLGVMAPTVYLIPVYVTFITLFRAKAVMATAFSAFRENGSAAGQQCCAQGKYDESGFHDDSPFA